MIDVYDGSKVVSAQAAELPITHRGDGSPLYTDKAKLVLLEDGRTMYVCGIGDCPEVSNTIQGIINQHLGKAHPEVVSYKPKASGEKGTTTQLLDMTLREVLDLATSGLTDSQYLQTRLELLTQQRNEAIAEKRAAQRELDSVQSAARKLLGGLSK